MIFRVTRWLLAALVIIPIIGAIAGLYTPEQVMQIWLEVTAYLFIAVVLGITPIAFILWAMRNEAVAKFQDSPHPDGRASDDS